MPSFALNKLENDLGNKLITINDTAIKIKKTHIHSLSNYQTIKIIWKFTFCFLPIVEEWGRKDENQELHII